MVEGLVEGCLLWGIIKIRCLKLLLSLVIIILLCFFILVFFGNYYEEIYLILIFILKNIEIFSDVYCIFFVL